jgi:hypothetical protein
MAATCICMIKDDQCQDKAHSAMHQQSCSVILMMLIVGDTVPLPSVKGERISASTKGLRPSKCCKWEKYLAPTVRLWDPNLARLESGKWLSGEVDRLLDNRNCRLNMIQ